MEIKCAGTFKKEEGHMNDDIDKEIAVVFSQLSVGIKQKTIDALRGLLTEQAASSFGLALTG